MKLFCTIIFTMFCITPVYSISSFIANYDLYGKTDLGNIKFGSAEYELISSNKAYVFKSKAKTDNIWNALYDYSINEISIGVVEDNKLIGDYYKVSDTKRGLTSDIEINMYPMEAYVSINNEIFANGFNKSHLEKLSDSELIIQALESGNRSDIKFTDIQEFDNDIPSYEKELINRGELINALLKPKLALNNFEMVDVLSIYLHISKDIKQFPNKKRFIYNLVDKNGIARREFIIIGSETININNNDLDTVIVACPELKITFNISKKHNFLPVVINKTNGKTNFQLTLTNYIKI